MAAADRAGLAPPLPLPLRLRQLLAELHPVSPAASARAESALRLLLAAARRSPRADRWSFSRLTADGFPVELSWAFSEPALRFVVDPAAPETPPGERFQRAARLAERLAGVALPPAVAARLRTRHAGATGGAWVGARHTSRGDAYKLYVTTSPSLPHRLGGGLRPCLSGYDLVGGRHELYLQALRLDLDRLAEILRAGGQAGRLGELLDLIAETRARPVDRRLPPGVWGLSVATRIGRTCAVSLFSPASSLLGDDPRTRRRLLSVAARRGWNAGVYERVTRRLRAPGRRPLHGLVSFVLPRGAPPTLHVGLQLPGSPLRALPKGRDA